MRGMAAAGLSGNTGAAWVFVEGGPVLGMVESTGIGPMDRMLGGGIPDGSSVLFVSEPVVESGIFGLHMVAAQRPASKFLVVLTRTRESAFRVSLGDYGLTALNFEVVDCYSPLVNEVSSSRHVVDNPRDFGEVRRRVLEAIDDSRGCFLFVDDVNAFIEYFGEERAEALVSEWQGRIKALGGVCAFLYTNWSGEVAMKEHMEALMDCVISLRPLERKVIFGQSFSIEKAGWTKVEPVAIPFKVVKPGGVRVFIPKILVTGPYNAGKSSFTHSASTRAVSVDRIGTTVALDHGHVDYKGFSIDLFGTPGQERFDPILDMLGSEAVGVVVVVDSTDAPSFPRALDMLKKTNGYGLPCVVVANKADLGGAMPVDGIRKAMSLDGSVPVIPVHAEDPAGLEKLVGKVPCALKKEDVNAVFDALFGLIFFRK